METIYYWVEYLRSGGFNGMAAWALFVGWLTAYNLNFLWKLFREKEGEETPYRFKWLVYSLKESNQYGGGGYVLVVLLYVIIAFIAGTGFFAGMAGDWEIPDLMRLLIGAGAVTYTGHTLLFAAAHKVQKGWNWVKGRLGIRRARKAEAEAKRRELEGDDLWQTFDTVRKDIRAKNAERPLFSGFVDAVDRFVDTDIPRVLEMRARLKVGIPAIAPFTGDANQDGKVDEQEARSTRIMEGMQKRLAALDRELITMRESLQHLIPVIVNAQTLGGGSEIATVMLDQINAFAAAVNDSMEGDDLATELANAANIQIRQLQEAATAAGAPTAEPEAAPTGKPARTRTT